MELDKEIACEIGRNIGQLWIDEQFVDLQIHVEDILFNCHQLILCACSKFFKVLLKSEVKGETEHPIRQVTIRGISPEIFQLVLKAIYKGENGLTTENMIEFWHAVHQLEIAVLESKCETFVIDHMTPENFVNIYQNALLLKSINMTKGAHQFVAQNFESFKDLEILLQQPASFIEGVIGSGSLVGLKQDHVVEFILKWVNYELCERETECVYFRDTERVCAENTVEDMSAQTNEVTTDKNGSVEVIFQKPLAASKDDCIKSLSGEPFVRKQSLRKLLKLVRLAEVNKESLELLVDNDLVMGSKETRDIVRQAMELVKSAPTSAISTSAASIDTEDTVVFVTNSDNKTIYAYSLDRGAIFTFCTTDQSISYIHTDHNKLLCSILNLPIQKGKDWYILQIIEFPFSQQMHEIGQANDYCVIVGDFCYTFNEHMCRRNIESNGGWYRLFAPAEHFSRSSLTVFKESILYRSYPSDRSGEVNIYCFNTKSTRHWHMMSCDFTDVTDCDFVTFTHDDQLYILFGNGVFTNVTNSAIVPAEVFSLPKYSEISKSCLLWDFQFKIYGAVVHHDNLVVFGEVSSILVSEIHECKIPGLKTIKFVHLYDLRTKCHPLIIPKKLLTQRL